MEQNNRKRPGTGVPRERPQTPASRPKNPRPKTGNGASREAARRSRSTAEPRSPAERRPRSQIESRPGREAPAAKREEQETRPARSDRARPSAQARKKTGASNPREKTPAARARKKKPHRVYNTNFGFKFVTMLAVVAVIVLSMIIFFKVKHITVQLPQQDDSQAKSYYTAEEVVNASGVNIDDNLLSLSKAAVAARIHAALPYINEIQIKKQLPGTVVISFTEFDVTYGIQDETGAWWLMSREGRILEPSTEQDARSHLIVTGMPIEAPQVGDYLKPAATEGADMSEIAAKKRTVLEIIPALEDMPFIKQIVSVDVSTSYDLTLWYQTRYQIRLGTTENLTYKLQFLQATLENKEIQSRSGTIDLTFNEDEKVHFLEFR